MHRGLSVFPANRGVLRHFDTRTFLAEVEDFQYSLRIVGFCDLPSSCTYSGPKLFQYSLRIVGFCDRSLRPWNRMVIALSVFPANRGVLRHRIRWRRKHFSFLSVFPANRGVLRPMRGIRCSGRTGSFQYSLRIVGFCDLGGDYAIGFGHIFQYSLRIVGFCD